MSDRRAKHYTTGASPHAQRFIKPETKHIQSLSHLFTDVFHRLHIVRAGQQFLWENKTRHMNEVHVKQNRTYDVHVKQNTTYDENVKQNTNMMYM